MGKQKIKLEGIVVNCRTCYGRTRFMIEGEDRYFSFPPKQGAPPINNGQYIECVATFYDDHFTPGILADDPLNVVKADIYEANNKQKGRLLHSYGPEGE